MISVERFIAPSSAPDEWHAARKEGVTATTVSKAATPAGFDAIIEAIENPEEFVDNDYMRFGREQEIPIMLEVKRNFGVMPNDWLICHEEYDWQLATPDGLSLDHGTIAEVKTTGKDFENIKGIPIHYRRQVQWQLHVTGAESCVFAWMLRIPTPDGYYAPGWIEPKFLVINRDEKMINQLITVAEKLRMHEVYKSQMEGN